jgi:hypothetical protein
LAYTLIIKKMKPKILLRIAAIIMLFHDFGHTYGHLTWKQSIDPVRQEVVKQMTDHSFPFMGAVHSLAEYYEGYGLACTLALLLIAATLWIISDVNLKNVILVRKILVVVSVILLAWGIDELIYFFPGAASFSLLACLIIVIAIFNLKHIPD